MSKTTIELPESTRDKLKDERLDHESNYGDTIERLLGDSTVGKLWTEDEIKTLVDQRLKEN